MSPAGAGRGADRHLRRPVKVLVGTLACVIASFVAAAPAGADPAEPTDDRARVTGLEPPTPGVHADVVGADSFLRLRVEGGHEVVVLGYEGEPYLRFGPDGTVEENRRSPATVLNTSRYGTEGDLSGTDPDAEPEWEVVGTDGSHVWHDHRIHWMSETDPPTLGGEDSGFIQDWEVDLVVDGEPVVVHGDLVRRPAPSPLPWLGVALAAAAVTVALGWRWARRGPAVALAAAGALAAATSLVAELDLPAETGRRWSLVAVPALAALCALGAAVAPRSRYAVALLVGAGAILPLWIGLRWGALTHALLPSPTAASLQRAAVALALGAVVGAVVVAAGTVASSVRAASERSAASPA